MNCDLLCLIHHKTKDSIPSRLKVQSDEMISRKGRVDGIQQKKVDNRTELFAFWISEIMVSNQEIQE